MTDKFTWERGPFEQCPSCREPDTFGFLSAGGTTMVLRCTACRNSQVHSLPSLDKKLIYLDQFALSALLHIESKGRDLGSHQKFWRLAHHYLRRLVLFQQVLLPHSNIHHQETIVAPFAQALREFYEHFGGDACLKDTDAIQAEHTWEMFRAYIEKREPRIEHGPDAVLSKGRHDWLPDMHISATPDYSSFKNKLWAGVERTSSAVSQLVDNWASQKPTFDEIFERELSAHGRARREVMLHIAAEAEKATAAGDGLTALTLAVHPVFVEFSMLRDGFRREGVPEDYLTREIVRFWDWDGHRNQPEAKIAAAMLAALGRKVVAGQKKVKGSFLNDVSAISTYAPSVDAMFVDIECAVILGELRDRISYRARIFSYQNQDEFLNYLKDLEARTPSDVKEYVARIYGVR